MSKWWRSHSVRVRLTLWYVAAMVVVLAVYAVAIYTFVSRSVSESLNQRLRADFFWAAATIDDSPGGVEMSVPQIDLLLEEEAPWVQVWSADGSQLLLRNAEALRRPIPDSQKLAAEGGDQIVSFATSGAPMRVLSRRSYVCPCEEDPVTLASIGKRPVTVQVARSEEAIQQQVGDLLLILVLGLPVAVSVAGLGGYVLARRALDPIEQMTARARTITAARLSDRLPVSNPDNEMGRLASVFNATLGRLEASFGQMRQFTADVSHELRTPLTAIRSVGEVGLRGHRDDVAYRSIIGSMLEEADRLASLVDRLLTLSRAETRQATLSRDLVDLSSLADDVVSHLGVLAEEKRQTLTVDRLATPRVAADRMVLRQALINLVDNAIKFTPAAGQIRIQISEAPADAIVDVIDSGPGIAHDAQGRIFDRFYRENEADAGGTGLGLSLARGAVEALGGHLTLEHTGAGGSAFRISLPRECP
ncbi:MAG TPA: HAMP domain-containing sensor histidine kinase [Vicinamibacterales bacterium]|nr:HAMP domain-containing sensor histidine kinase [Vicinamibacterales bacterium]